MPKTEAHGSDNMISLNENSDMSVWVCGAVAIRVRRWKNKMRIVINDHVVEIKEASESSSKLEIREVWRS